MFHICRFVLLLAIFGHWLAYCNSRYQKFFVNTRAINFVDATKHGFRIILLDSFVEKYLAPTQIPTLFITAVPLKSGEKAITRIFYPDNVRDDKQVSIGDLDERSWYYVCVEWENFNRHNESTGTDCRTLRTLDRNGKNADSTIEDIELIDITSTAMHFKLQSLVDFPIRLTVSLEGGTGPLPPAQTFVYKERYDIQVSFQFLAQDHDYGKLCVIEEPLVTGYTIMGRLVAQLYLQKCYFNTLRTKDYELSNLDPEASVFRREVSTAMTAKLSSVLLLPSLLVPLFNKLR